MMCKLLKKAYEIDFNRIDEGFLWGQTISYADTRGKAKLELLLEVEGVKLNYTNEEVTYLNIPVIRCKQADKMSFEGQEMTLWQIENELTERKRIAVLEEILKNENIQYCYIRKGGYYRPNSSGYTEFKHMAGVYSKEEAVSHAKSCRDIQLETIDVSKHNQMLQDEIKDLNTRVLA